MNNHLTAKNTFPWCGPYCILSTTQTVHAKITTECNTTPSIPVNEAIITFEPLVFPFNLTPLTLSHLMAAKMPCWPTQAYQPPQTRTP